jgi:hypothetical protein
VPDIRLHCARLANHLSAGMREGMQASEPGRKPPHPVPTGAAERSRHLKSPFMGLA